MRLRTGGLIALVVGKQLIDKTAGNHGLQDPQHPGLRFSGQDKMIRFLLLDLEGVVHAHLSANRD